MVGNSNTGVPEKRYLFLARASPASSGDDSALEHSCEPWLTGWEAMGTSAARGTSAAGGCCPVAVL